LSTPVDSVTSFAARVSAAARKKRQPDYDADRSPDQGALVTEPSQGVFLSYASEDAEAARRICKALSAAGIEV
jgi:hypothetical protein